MRIDQLQGWYSASTEKWAQCILDYIQMEKLEETLSSTEIWFANKNVPYNIAPLPSLRPSCYTILVTERKLTKAETNRLVCYFDALMCIQELHTYSKLIAYALRQKQPYVSPEYTINMIRKRNDRSIATTKNRIYLQTELAPEELTTTECVIIHYIIEGKNNRQIAGLLHYARNTITSKLNVIFHKLDLSSRRKPALIQKGIKEGWIVIESIQQEVK